MAFITAVRHKVDAVVAYHGSDTEKYLREIGGLHAPLLMHLGEEDEFISKTAQAKLKQRFQKSRTPPFTAILVNVTRSPDITACTTMPRRLCWRTAGQANF